MTEPWETVVARKQAETAAKIPAAWRLPAEFTADISETSTANVLDVPRRSKLLSDKQLKITEQYDATSLLEKLHAGQLSAYEVTEAFCIRAAIAQQVTRCLTETMFDEALKRAQELDEHLKKTGQLVGPLHGLPISFKDCFNIKGVPSTIGFTSFVKDGPVQNDSAVVEVLVRLGAIPHVKTNIPQTMMAADSHNYVFGRTLNPNRLNLSAGGSSGGEGALIAMRGSVLGVGTDIAGSIRIPGICNGTFSFKPTNDRVPVGGQVSASRTALAAIRACAGPLATSVRDLELFMKLVTSNDPWELDPSAIFSPWREVKPKSFLRLGLIVEDPHFPIHPPVQRTLNEAVEKLKKAGHDIIPLDHPSIRDACVLGFRMFAMDPHKLAAKRIAASGEPTIPALATTSLPYEGFPEEYLPLTLESLCELKGQMALLKEQFRDIITTSKLDAIIMPGYQTTAPPHDLYSFPSYTVLWNVLDYPASIVPFGKADKVADKPFIREVDYKPPYAPDAIEGAPCCVQIAGRNMRDEELVTITQTITDVLKA